MKKIFVFLTVVLLFMQQGYSQDTVWIENFDNPSISFSISPHVAKVEFCEHKGGGVFGSWQVLPTSTYRGASTSYRNNLVFSAAAYSEFLSHHRHASGVFKVFAC